MVMKTSLLITGDATIAKKAVEDVAAAVSKLGTGARGAAAPVQQLDQAMDATTASTRELAAATASAEKAQTAATTANLATATAARELAQSLGQAAAAQSNVTAIMQQNAAAQSAQLAVIQAIVTEGRQLATVFGMLSSAGTASAGALNAVGAEALKAASGVALVETETRQAANAQTLLDAATRRVLQAVDEEALGLLKLNDLLDDAKLAMDAGRISQEQYARVQALGSKASDANTRSLGQQKAGMFSLGQQTQDIGIQLSMGTDLMRVMAMQGGQLATALDMIGVKGAGGRVAAFFAGPYGAVILTATAILGPLAAKYFDVGQEQNKAAKTTLTFSDALTKQKFATDAGREAIKAYNDAQKQASENTELAIRRQLAGADAILKTADATRLATQQQLEATKARVLDSMSIGGDRGDVASARALSQVAALNAQIAKQKELNALIEQARRNLLVKIGVQKGEAAVDRLKAIDLQYNLQRQQAERAASRNTALARTLNTRVAAIERLRTAEKAAYQEEQQRNNAASRRTASDTARGVVTPGDVGGLLKGQFGGTVTSTTGGKHVRNSYHYRNQAVDFVPAGGMGATSKEAIKSFLQEQGITLKELLGPGDKGHSNHFHVAFSKTASFAGATRDANRSTKDTQREAKEAADQFQRMLEEVVTKYLPATAAAKDYADELARIDALAKAYDGKTATSGLSPDQANAARAALKAANDRRVAEINLTPEAKAAADAKTAIEGVIAALTREQQVRQTLDPVQRAMIEHQAELAKMSDVERVAYEAKLRALYAQDEAYTAATEAARAAADAQRYFRDMALDAFDAVVVGGEKAGDVIGRLAKTIASAAIEAAVLGTGPLAALLKGGGNTAAVAGPAAQSATGAAAQAAADLTGKSFGKIVGDKLEGVFGKGTGAAMLKNAGFGSAAAGVTGGNSITGALGGALGGQVAGKLLGSLGGFAGPLGSIAGGIIGGMLPKLFASVKTGSATLSNVNGAAGVSGTSGNSAAYRKASTGMAGAIGDQLDAIVQQFNADLGDFSVSIGQRKKKFVVDAAGTGKTKGSGTTSYDTAEEAQMAALVNALADGAVKGVSARVAQALRSSTDVTKAVAEAAKVQDLETLMGGITGQIDKAFREFETVARERVRIAGQYGFDLVAIERKNGEDRARLAKELATQQVGSLQKLIEEMTSGGLFEGTAMDQIAAINVAIAKAKADLDAGVEGAGDTLADLYGKRLAASKEAYGTTSGYAADRTATLDEARAAVARANARITAAQGGAATSDPALATTNAALDENNDQNARMLTALETNTALLRAVVGRVSGGQAFDLTALAAV